MKYKDALHVYQRYLEKETQFNLKTLQNSKK